MDGVVRQPRSTVATDGPSSAAASAAECVADCSRCAVGTISGSLRPVGRLAAHLFAGLLLPDLPPPLPSSDYIFHCGARGLVCLVSHQQAVSVVVTKPNQYI